MKLTPGFVALVSLSCASPALAMNLAGLGLTALGNFFRTPHCAMRCILDTQFIRTYAPECADLSAGSELGRRLCENRQYQVMIDGCFKENCNDDERRTVDLYRPLTIRLVISEGALARVSE
jgi:hypothetical protein